MTKKALPQNIINPITNTNQEHWDLWKQYKMEEFRFKYKGCLSEQAALMNLNDLSKNDENIAVEIIKQSMANGWKGFFGLKNNKNGAKQINASFTRDEVSAEFNNRNYGKR